MNGECKSYKLNDPMTWKEFKSMPDDIKVTYIKLLRQKFNAPVTQIAKMMHVTEAAVRTELKRLNLAEGKTRSGRIKWDKEGFWAWANGAKKLPTPVPAEEPTQEEKVEPDPVQPEEPETFVEDDLPFEEPDPIPADDIKPFPVLPVCATPINGSMQFKCPADQALNTLAQILGQANCAISIMWRVIEEGDDDGGQA